MTEATPITRVALAGATGNLGRPILSALLAAGFHVTALSRTGGNAAATKLGPHPRLTVAAVDFASVASLTPALRGVEAVVSCVATRAIGSQDPLIEAAAAAGVRRFVPAEFGMDSQNPLAAQLPVCAPKVATQRRLWEVAREYPDFTWTAIANGLFLDWCLAQSIILDLAHHNATLYNGGDVPFSATLLADIARAVLGVLAHPTETANRVVYVHSARVTQNQLLRYAEEEEEARRRRDDGRAPRWTTTVQSTEAVRRESLAKLANSTEEADVDAAMLGFSIVGCGDSEYGCDFSGRLDNELLGIREMTEEELRALVASFL